MLSNNDFEKIEQILKRQLSAFGTPLNERMDSMDKRMDSMDKRMDSMDQRFDSIEQRLGNLEQDVREIKVDILENNVLPRLKTIEDCYLDTSKRYMESTGKFESAIIDIEVMKLAIQKNSSDIQELKRKQA